METKTFSEQEIKQWLGLYYFGQSDGQKPQQLAMLQHNRPDFYKACMQWLSQYEQEQKKQTEGIDFSNLGIIKEPRPIEQNPIMLECLADVTPQEAEWLIPVYIPRNQITLIAGDGGTGKTSIWCNIAAALTSGRQSIFDQALGNEDKETGNVLFFSSEDSVPIILRPKLEAYGADMTKIRFMSLDNPQFESIKFNSPMLLQLIEQYRPSLVIFDPLQSFVPANIDMSRRNAMRQCLSPLIGLGEKYNTTFLIILHTNKRQQASGRNRIADSADIWDIARSVLICGETGCDGVRYISHEKSSYGIQGRTILYHIEGGTVVYDGTSDKKDRDYISENSTIMRQAPARAEAKEAIMNYLKSGKKKISEMDEAVMATGVTRSALKRAKQELKEEGSIKRYTEGFGANKVWYVELTSSAL